MFIEKTKYEAIPAGVYPAVIEEIIPENGQYGEQLKFKFHLDPFEGYEAGKDLHAWASKRFNVKTKLYKWAKAALGESVVNAPGLDVDQMLKARVLLVVGQTEKDGTIFEHIDQVLPVQRSKTIEQVNTDLENVEDVMPF